MIGFLQNDGQDVNEAVQVISDHINHVSEFVGAESFANALSLLEAISQPFVDYIVDHTKSVEGFDDETRESVEFTFGELENAWQATLEGSTLDADKASGLFKTLAEFRVALTDSFGPLFSDPLRSLKKIIKKKGAEEQVTGKRPADGAAEKSNGKEEADSLKKVKA